MEWIILLFIVLFLIGRMQRSSAGHPANLFSAMTPNTPAVTGATSGDSFPSNVTTIAAGIPQPMPIGIGSPIVVPHTVFPIAQISSAPPPLAIQKPVLNPPKSTLNPLAPKPIGTGAGAAAPLKTANPAPISVIAPAPPVRINTTAPRPIITRTYGAPRYRGY